MILPFLVTIFMGGGNQSTAATITFTDEAAFLSAVPNATTESFEGLTPDNVSDSRSLISVGSFQLTADGKVLSVNDIPRFGFAATDGSNYVEISDNDSNGSFAKFAFSVPQLAFGLNIVDWGDSSPGSLLFTNDIGDAGTIETNPPFRASGNILYFGVLSDTPFTEFTITNTVIGGVGTGMDFFVIDKVSTAPVPEPGTIILFSIGALSIIGIGYRQRRNKRM